MYTIGVDLGGTNIAIGLCDESLNIIDKGSVPTLANREAELPFDTHMLKAMVAPRTLFVSEAAGDIWANPVGSWQTTMAAAEVFRFLDAKENLFWYFRPGTHYHEISDIQMLVNIICMRTKGHARDPRFFKLPFRAPDLIFDWRAPN